MKKRLSKLVALLWTMVLTVGCFICITYADNEPVSTPMPSEPMDIELTPGDVNLDDAINAEDALLVLLNAAKIGDFEWHEEERADVDTNGIIDAEDALNILKYAANILDSFEDVILPTLVPFEPTEVPTETVRPTNQPSGCEMVDALNVDVDYNNSFIAEAEVDEQKNFTTADFPGLALTDVWTRGKIKTENGYIYQLIMVLDRETCNEEVLKEEMKKAEELEMITNVNYNGYCEHESILKLNHSEYVLKVGESIDLNIADYRPYNPDDGRVGIILKIKDQKINNEAVTLESLEKYGVISLTQGPYIPTGTSFWKKYEIDTEIDYYLSVYESDLENGEISHLSVAHLLSQIPEIEMVQVVILSQPPAGNRYYEYWECSDETIALMELHNSDETDEVLSQTNLNQTATITGLAPGEVTISIRKGGWGSREGTGTCVIKIVE